MPSKNKVASFEIRGIKELADQLKELDKAVVGPQIYDVLGKATRAWRQRFIQEATGKRWPKKAIASAFTYAKPQPGEQSRKRATSLFGIRKKGRAAPYAPGYVEWFAAKSPPKHPKKQVTRKRAPGELTGMSLATMFELGTTKIGARPAFKPSLYASRETMKDIIEDGVWAILEQVAGKKRPVSQQMPGIGGEFD